MDKFNLRQIQRFFLVLLSGIIIILLLYMTWKFLFPFVLAWLLSWFLKPFIHLLHNKLRIPKFLSILIMIGLISSIFISLTIFFITKIVYMIQNLSNRDFTDYVQTINVIHDQFITWMDFSSTYVNRWVGSMNPTWEESFYKYIEELKQSAIQLGIEYLHSFLQMFSGGLASLPGLLMACGIVVIATFFISKDWETISNYLHNTISKNVRSPFQRIALNFKNTIKQLFKAQFILMFITIGIVYIGLIIFQVPHPLTLALVAGLVDFIPYIGTGIIFVPWIFYSFITDQFPMTIQLTSLYMIIIVTRQVFEPKILASHFGVPPLLLLIGLFLGFQLWGALTILITPAIIAFIKALHSSGVAFQLWRFIIGKPSM